MLWNHFCAILHTWKRAVVSDKGTERQNFLERLDNLFFSRWVFGSFPTTPSTIQHSFASEWNNKLLVKSLAPTNQQYGRYPWSTV
jgi:hypothetical protein